MAFMIRSFNAWMPSFPIPTAATSGIRSSGHAVRILPAFCLWLILALSGPVFAQKIIVAGSAQVKPYGTILIDLLTAAGFAPEVSYYPLERSFRMLQDGEIDLEFVRTAEAVEPFKQDVALIGPTGCIELTAFTRLNTPIKIRRPQDLAGRKVALFTGNRFAQLFLKANNISFETIALKPSLYQMLAAGRIDIVVDQAVEGLFAIKSLQLEGEVGQNGNVLTSTPNYLVLRHHLSDWGPRIQNALDKAKASQQWHQQIRAVNQSMGLPANLILGCITPKPR